MIFIFNGKRTEVDEVHVQFNGPSFNYSVEFAIFNKGKQIEVHPDFGDEISIMDEERVK